MSESMSCWICATIESALDDMAMLLLYNRWVVLPIIAQSRRSFNAATCICRFQMRLHGFWSYSNDFLDVLLIHERTRMTLVSGLSAGLLSARGAFWTGWCGRWVGQVRFG